MEQPPTSDYANERANAQKRRWQFGLKHWFGFSALVAFLLGYYVALYPATRMILPVVVVAAVLLALLRPLATPRRRYTFAEVAFAVIAIYLIGSLVLGIGLVFRPQDSD